MSVLSKIFNKQKSGVKPLSMHYLNNPNNYGTSLNDNFGRNIACSNKIAVVGAPLEGDSSGNYSGSVYIYDFETGEMKYNLVNPNNYDTREDDRFGWAVACTDSHTVIGARTENSAGGGDSGVAYVYSNHTGELLFTLTNPNIYAAASADFYGWSVGVSDTHIAVSAAYEDDAGGNQSGVLYIYSITGALLWSKVNPNTYGTTNLDYFGYDVDCSETYTISGANQEDYSGTIINSGAAYIFNNSTGALLHTLTNPILQTEASNSKFGNSVSICETYSVVGAPYNNGIINGGNIHVFNNATGLLEYSLDNPNYYGTTSSDQFGFSVSITEKYIIASAIGEDMVGFNLSGVVYVFDTPTGELLHTIVNPNIYDAPSGDYFGYATSVSDTGAFVGTFYEDSSDGTESGAAYMYKFDSNFNVRLENYIHNPNNYNTSNNDNFGVSCARSDNYSVAGTNYEDDAGGLESGIIYIFDNKTGSIINTIPNPNHYGTSSNDNFGVNVACTDTYTIAGAHSEDDATNNDTGVAYLFNTVTGALLHTLENPNQYSTPASDFFGWDVGLNDTHCIVGAYGEDDASGILSGAAYIFNNSTGNLVHTLTNPNVDSTGAGDRFGWSVNMSETYCVVGAPNESDNAGVIGESGAAYIFNNSTGALLHTLENPNAYSTSNGDEFGYSVDINDSYTAVGAFKEDDVGGVTSGVVYIYNTVTGALLHTLTNPNPFGTSANDYFGFTVSVSSKYTYVGSAEGDESDADSGKGYLYDNVTGDLIYTFENPVVDPYSATDSSDSFGLYGGVTNSGVTISAHIKDNVSGGAVYTYSFTDDPSSQVLENPNVYSSTVIDDYFGSAVSASNTHMVVGAYGEDDAGGTESGVIYIYDTNSILKHTIVNPDAYNVGGGDNFGFSVGISDKYCVAGAPYEDDATYIGIGKAYIFDNYSGALLWTLSNPNNYDTPETDYFGYSVDCSDTHTIVGAYSEDDAGGLKSGAAYIYNTATGALLWTLTNPNEYDTSAGDRFGIDVSCSDTYSVVAADKEDDAGGLDSGVVYIYTNSTGALLHTLTNPNIYGTSLNDYFGSSVSCCESYTAVGSFKEDHAGGTQSGVIYIYDNVTGNLLFTIENPNKYGTETNDQFGIGLSISENYIVVGANKEESLTHANLQDSGVVYVFDTVNGKLLHTLDNPNVYGTSLDDNFGKNVSVSDLNVIVGVPNEDVAAGQTGTAYKYNLFRKQ